MLRRTFLNLFRNVSKHRTISRFCFSKSSKPHSRKWTKEFARDPFVKKARELDYRSRASFKLLEIETRFKLIKKAKRILELGCFPGGWTQILQEQASAGTKILGVDLLKTQKLPQRNEVTVKMIQGDVFKLETQSNISEYFQGNPMNLIVCDVSPHFVGDLDIDHHHISNMNLDVLNLCEKLLSKGGSLVIKTLHGTDEKKIYELFEVNFKNVKRVKPSASRAKSAELYYVCLGYKQTEFWKKVGDLNPKERTLEKMMELMPEKIRMNHDELNRIKTTFKYQLAHNQIEEESLNSKIQKDYFSELKKEMEEENFVKKNKKNPKYTVDDLSKMYEKFCEENNYKYSYMKKLPSTIDGVVEEYKKMLPKINEEIEEMLRIAGNTLEFKII
jgi:23S rRNA (uridine2552-2'-O)-methyltransferase